MKNFAEAIVVIFIILLLFFAGCNKIGKTKAANYNSISKINVTKLNNTPNSIQTYQPEEICE